MKSANVHEHERFVKCEPLPETTLPINDTVARTELTVQVKSIDTKPNIQFD